MPTTKWTDANGDFNSAANWDNGVPVAGEDAIIAGSSASPFTVTFSSGSVTAQTLTTTFTTLSLSGGNLVLEQASALDALIMSGGTLEFQNGGTGSTASTFSGPVTEAGGTLRIDAGTVVLNGTNQLAGHVTGGGSLVTTGSSAVDGLQIGNGATLDNQGTETLTSSNMFLGDFSAGTATLENEAGATFDIFGNAGIQPGGGNTGITNAGLFEKIGGTGTSTIGIGFSNTGSVLVNAGTLTFSGGGTYAGTISGTGTVRFTGAAETWSTGLTLNVTALRVDNTLNLGGDVSYGGALDASSAILALGTNSLTLTATSTTALVNTHVTGTGTGSLVTQGTDAVDGLQIGNGATLDNQGTETLTSSNMFLGDFSAGTATLENEAGATFDILGNAGIQSGGGTTGITNAGLFEKTGGTGTSTIGIGFSNTGSVLVNAGTLTFSGGGTYAGTISGTGTVRFTGAAQTWAAGLTLDVAAVQVSNTLNLDGDVSYGGALNASSATLALGTHSLTLTATSTTALASTLVTGTGSLVTQGTTRLTVCRSATARRWTTRAPRR